MRYRMNLIFLVFVMSQMKKSLNWFNKNIYSNSCGVHPWNASLDTFEFMLPLLKKAPL